MRINDYLMALQARGHSPTTIRLRRIQLEAFARAMGEPTPEAVTAWLARPMAANTRASEHGALSGYCRWAGIPMDVPRPRVPPTTKRDIPDQVVAAVLADATPEIRRAVILGRWAGLRAAEIAACHRDWWTPGSLWVVGKGGRSRVVPVGRAVDEVMGTVAGFVFPGRFGGHVRPGTVTKWLAEALPGPWTAHSLRHAYASDFYTACGFDLIWTAEVLGHSSTETTRRYVHGRRDATPVVARIGANVA